MIDASLISMWAESYMPSTVVVQFSAGEMTVMVNESSSGSFTQVAGTEHMCHR